MVFVGVSGCSFSSSLFSLNPPTGRRTGRIRWSAHSSNADFEDFDEAGDTESLAEDGGGALDPPSRRCSNASSSSNISTAFKETPPVLLLFAEETSAVRNGFKVFPRLLDFPGEAFVTSPKTVLVFLEFVSLFINFFFEEADESFFFSFFNAPILLYIDVYESARARKSKYQSSVLMKKSSPLP